MFRFGAVALTGLVLAGCSSGHRSSTPPPPTTTTSTTLSPTAVAVAKRVNTNGFVVDVVSADATATPQLLVLQTLVTDTLPTPQQFIPVIMVTDGGRVYEGHTDRSATIAPGATVPVQLDVPVDSAFTMAGAVLTFGNATKNQASVPLGAAGAYVSRLDKAMTPPAPLTAGEQSFTFTRAVVSAYRADGSELDAGTEELIVSFDVHNADPVNSYAVTSSQFAFARGAEMLPSSVLGFASANAGGEVTGARVAVDIGRYTAGQTVTLTVTGTDAQQHEVQTTTLFILPVLD